MLNRGQFLWLSSNQFVPVTNLTHMIIEDSIIYPMESARSHLHWQDSSSTFYQSWSSSAVERPPDWSAALTIYSLELWWVFKLWAEPLDTLQSPKEHSYAGGMMPLVRLIRSYNIRPLIYDFELYFVLKVKNGLQAPKILNICVNTYFSSMHGPDHFSKVY